MNPESDLATQGTAARPKAISKWMGGFWGKPVIILIIIAGTCLYVISTKSENAELIFNFKMSTETRLINVKTAFIYNYTAITQSKRTKHWKIDKRRFLV